MVKIEIHQEIFSLSGVAQILGIPQTRVKNWTIGRPLQIRPSIPARGTGSRNLYGLYDIYRIEIANQLHQNGFRPQVIQRVLDALGEKFTTCVFVVISAGVDWTKNRTKLAVQLIENKQWMREGWEIVQRPIANSMGCFVLNTLSLIQRVDGWAEDFLESNPPEWQESKRRGKRRIQMRGER
jgi:DNA-binding transcriptional MerR regulator